MYIPLGCKTDFSLLKSLIKIPDLLSFLKSRNVDACGILDDNLFSSIPFYKACEKEGIKPIIGLKIMVNKFPLYLYAKDYEGYLSLLKVNTLMQQRDLNYIDLKSLKKNVILVLPYKSIDIYKEVKDIYDYFYIGFSNSFEKKNALLLSNNVLYVEEVISLIDEDLKYIKILDSIDDRERDFATYKDCYLDKEVDDFCKKTCEDFSNLIDFVIPKGGNYIPHYDDSIKDSYKYLSSLCIKGLEKRLDGKVSDEYSKRLKHELDVINSMGFVDYFLIVYDYVKYAKKHDILVGPGRGSAAGSLVSYSIGITEVDPIKYNLLFERFLNPERITMPDIDIDFEYTKRDQVISYVKKRYGENRVSNIMTYGTLGSRQVIRDVAKVLEIDTPIIDKLCNLLDPKISLKENLNNKYVSSYVREREELKKLYKISMKLEGLKRHISTHAAGVVISSVDLDSVIPICISSGEVLTGVTMEYLEDLGLLKMDFLALKNLTIIKDVLELIKRDLNVDIKLNKIPLDDKITLDLFKRVDTIGIFQFESSGMMNFLSKLKVSSFADLIAAVALFRPGPMENIDTYIKRKEGREKVTYLDPLLEPILKDTYGIMIYQEQIMQALVSVGGYKFSEADNIRRAMSKKKKDVMEREREVFVSRAAKNNISSTKALEIYDMIAKFANYGFNKAHSVSYAMIGYVMGYLKSHYPVYFMATLLNMSIGADIKTKDYIDEVKKYDVKIYKPSINVSRSEYLIKDKALLLPLTLIHGVGMESYKAIALERKNGPFSDFFNFVCRCYGKSVNRGTIEALIDADAFRDFNINHKTLYNSLDSAIDYAILCSEIDESLVMKPNYTSSSEYSDVELMNKELEVFGFYVTNHPASKYKDGIVKINEIKKYFDKYVENVVIIGNVRKIKTKKGEDMGFLDCSDETGSLDYVIFPKKNAFLNEFKKDDLVRIRGQVTRRLDKYQIVVSNMTRL